MNFATTLFYAKKSVQIFLIRIICVLFLTLRSGFSTLTLRSGFSTLTLKVRIFNYSKHLLSINKFFKYQEFISLRVGIEFYESIFILLFTSSLILFSFSIISFSIFSISLSISCTLSMCNML